MPTSEHSPRADSVALLLDRHALRRASGVPTVSVVVGPVGPAVRAVRAWSAIRSRATATGYAADVRAALGILAQHADRERDLAADVLALLAAHTGEPASELRAVVGAMSCHDLDRFFAARETRMPPAEPTRLARHVLGAVVAGETPSSERWAGEACDPLAALAGLVGLLSADGLPVLVLTPPSSGGVQEWLRAAGSCAVEMSARVPALPLAIAVPPEDWSRYLAGAPEGRVKATLREGAIELPVLDRGGVEGFLRQSGGEPTPIPPPVEPLLSGGVSGEFAAALAGAVAAPTRAATEEEDDQARSAAERFLYEFLESLPATAGRFELNADAGFPFGARAAEVDLFARDLRIVVEIDGYYHFRDEGGYRRDRRKDWELQRRGILVLRFLADDIIPRLEEVRDRILDAVALRTTGSTA
jgi:hypothetical protein